MISLIVAHDSNCAIGYQNDLPWHLPKDLEYFKEKTLNKTVVMGRKTFESIGRALPKRRNIVITSDKNYHAQGIEVVHSIESALTLAQEGNAQEIMVIGGEQIFKAVLPLADRLYITQIDHVFEGDTYFPAYLETFKELSCSPAQAHDDFKYYYKVFQANSL